MDKALKHFKKVDLVLYEIGLKIEPLEFEKSNDYFVSLTREIIGQQLSGKVADVIFERFKDLFPKKKITARYLLTIPDQRLRDVGTSWGKVSFLKDLAEKVSGGEVDLKTIDNLENEKVTELLLKIKGVGPWTAEMFLMFALQRPDVFSTGDLGLQNAIIKLYKLKDKPSHNKLLEISAKWSPHRTIASRILWRSLELK
ncbi:MAG: hypothetical protein ACD_37C00275G0005 [uncultured bacterium]|nr:MAG: hypothetical protein ACD_37C00275G0005 [uncultured bacterium]